MKRLCLLLALLLVMPLLFACTGNGTQTETEGETTVTELKKTEPLTTADFMRDGDTFTLTVGADVSTLPLGERFTFVKGVKWHLYTDSAMTDEELSKTMTLRDGENVGYLKVNYRTDEVSTYKVVVNRTDKVTVTFSNDGAFIPTQTIAKGAKAVKPADPVKTGYTFDGWYLDGKAFDFNTAVNGDVTLMAHFTRKTAFVSTSGTVTKFEDQKALLNIVWHDYADVKGLRPDHVNCTLTRFTASGSTVYTVRVTKTGATWVGDALTGANLGQSEYGDWTVAVTDLPDGSYTFYQNHLTGNYTTVDSGNSAINTISGYAPYVDGSASLYVKNGQLYDKAGNHVVLNGLVTVNVGNDGSNDNYNETILSNYKAMGVTAIRVTMQLIGNRGTTVNSGFIFLSSGGRSRTSMFDYKTDTKFSDADRKTTLAYVDQIVEACSRVGMYVILDWGILTSNPNVHTTYAKVFFEHFAEKYTDNPYLLYEICNEPCKNDTEGNVGWGKTNGDSLSIKYYAENMIDAIRSHGAENVIIVAAKQVTLHISDTAYDDPIHDPLDCDRAFNVAYSCHSYAPSYAYSDTGFTHAWRWADAHKAGLCVICTEISPVDGTLGTGNTKLYDLAEGEKYLRLFQEYGFSTFFFRGQSASGTGYDEGRFWIDGLDLSNPDCMVRENTTMAGRLYYDYLTGGGVMVNPDYTHKNIVKTGVVLTDDYRADYGIAGTVWPGFAVKKDNPSTGVFRYTLSTVAGDELTDAQYTLYCSKLLDLLKSNEATVKVKSSDAVPSTKTDFSVQCTNLTATYTLTVSYTNAGGAQYLTVSIR